MKLPNVTSEAGIRARVMEPYHPHPSQRMVAVKPDKDTVQTFLSKEVVEPGVTIPWLQVVGIGLILTATLTWVILQVWGIIPPC